MSSNEPVSFTIDIIGDFTGEKWVGQFEVKPRLSYRDQLKEDQIRRELLGKDSEHAGEDARNYSRLFSGLSVRLVKTPKWWVEYNNGLDLTDQNLIVEIYTKTMDIVKAAAEETVERAENAKAELIKAAPSGDKSEK